MSHQKHDRISPVVLLIRMYSVTPPPLNRRQAVVSPAVINASGIIQRVSKVDILHRLLIRKVEKSLQNPGNSRRVLHAHFCAMAFTQDTVNTITREIYRQFRINEVRIYDMGKVSDVNKLKDDTDLENTYTQESIKRLMETSEVIAIIVTDRRTYMYQVCILGPDNIIVRDKNSIEIYSI